MHRIMIIGLIGLLWGSIASADPTMLYGTITTRQELQLTGHLRWGEEESLWLHHFNGDKAAAPDLSELDEADRQAIFDHQPGPQVRIGGHVVEFVKLFGSSEIKAQSFAIEFGAISALKLGSDEQVTVVLRDGSELQAEGGSNDIGTEVSVKTNDGSQHQIDWQDIESVVFATAPAQAPRFPYNLYGAVISDMGTYQGFIEWDNDERVGGDILDGEEGGSEVTILFSDIRSIAKQGQGSLVTTLNGNSRFLTGSNDVNADNRGVIVMHPDLGRLRIPWRVFQSVTFAEPPTQAAPTYDDYRVGPLRGRVTTQTGQNWSGHLLFDIDAGHSAETLNAYHRDIEFTVPLRLLSNIEVVDAKSCRLRWQNGHQLVLTQSAEVTASNSGIVVRENGTAARRYLPWQQVQSLHFQH